MKKVFEPLVQSQSYKNILYIVLTFILSNIYFVFFTTGYSLSFGLAFILIGIPLFIAIIYIARKLGNFEILVANSFLQAQINDKEKPSMDKGFSGWLKNLIANDLTWKRVIYFFLKFPLDIIMFALAVSFLGMSLKLILAPVLMQYAWVDFYEINWLANYLPTFLISVIGVIFMIFTFHLVNAIASIYKKFTHFFLTVN